MCALAFLCFGRSAVAQDPDRPPPPIKFKPKPTPTPSDSDYEIVRTNSNLVVVPVSVTNASGEPVAGLKASDFRLEEDGRIQEIAEVGDPEQVPLEIALLLDVSGSVDARFGFEQQAAARFLREVLKPGDHAIVYAIDARPRLEQSRTTAEMAVTRLVGIVPVKGSTAFFDTVVEASRDLATTTPPRHRRVIVVISDGEDTSSVGFKSVELALAEVQRADAAFYSINPSGESIRLNVISRRGQDVMQRLATATGGSSFLPERLEDLDAVFRRITAELRSQYLLQYYSNDTSTNGRFIRITVGAPARPDLKVRARSGYYARSAK